MQRARDSGQAWRFRTGGFFYYPYHPTSTMTRTPRGWQGMLRHIFISVRTFYEQAPVSVSLAVAAVVLLVDYLTGRAVQFPIVYALPVGMAAWTERKAAAALLAFFLPCARVIFHYPWHAVQPLSVTLLNALIAAVALLLYAYLVDRVAWQTRRLKGEVKVLQGLLPICASCKRIRTDTGEYEPIEHYIAERSEVSFSHGICPECARKLYPEYFQEDKA